MQRKLWTIGHSTLNITAFIALLEEHEIGILVDIRRLPGSRKFPQFNQDRLAASLAKAQIGYQHAAGLGGRRKKQPDSPHTIWRNPSFRAYADYMETDLFEESIGELMALARNTNVCICCSEAVWWRCHRSMIADYLKSKDWQVYHIMRPGKTEAHPYTQAARLVDGRLTYGAATEPKSGSAQ